MIAPDRPVNPHRPVNVAWDITFACPLRCAHCYSESGRRPSRELDHADQLRIADAIVALRPAGVSLVGGEPLLVRGVFQIAGRIARAGIPVALYTGGWRLEPWMVTEATRMLTEITVSVDGATADVHDRIRGRAGSFTRAMAALTMLAGAARTARAATGRGPRVGLDYVVVRSNLHQLDDVCTRLAPRVPGLDLLNFGAVAPTGLANRATFADAELLTDEQADRLGSAAEERRLQALAPASVRVTTTDNRHLQMHPDRLARGAGFPVMQVEPDGEVRAMAIYEGTVGNLLTEPGEVLWRRSVDRWTDPFVTGALGPARSMAQWADAARRIDYHFGSDVVRARIDRRPPYEPLSPQPGPQPGPQPIATSSPR